MKARTFQISLLISGLILSTLACNLPSVINRSQPEVIPTANPLEAQQVQEQIASQLNSAASGSIVTVELTESQLTNLINLQSPSSQDAQFTNLSVLLDNNQAQITGKITTSFLSSEARIVLGVATDEQGKPTLSIVSATMGGMTIPESMLSNATVSINDALKNQAGQGYEILSLSIADHKLIITAKKL